MENKKKIFTIPNILSFFRLLLIPFFIYAFFRWENTIINGSIVLISGITDVLDGIIARKFNMVSDLGKMLDPIADKFSQLALCICLSIKFNVIIVLLVLLITRDLFMLVSGSILFKKFKYTFSALWYGKIATASTYICLMCYLFFPNGNQIVLLIFTSISAILVALSFVMYVIHNFKVLKSFNNSIVNK